MLIEIFCSYFLFANQAAELVKVGGRIVYSTCTYNVAENEEIVLWALRKFPSLKLIDTGFRAGQSGWKIEGLDDEHCRTMHRFGDSRDSAPDLDSIGFFLCCFEKKSPL